MEAIRKIQTVIQGEIHLTLPESFWGKEVEVIVLTTDVTEPPNERSRNSLRGTLRQYANPDRKLLVI